MTAYSKPLPKLNEDNEGFWESCKAHAMGLQKCDDCSEFRYFPGPVCTNCGSFNFAWTRVSGRGEVFTYTVVHRPPDEAWAQDVPYTYALVRLDEGPMLPTNIVGVDPDDVKIGMRVQVTYDDVTSEITVPKFRPA